MSFNQWWVTKALMSAQKFSAEDAVQCIHRRTEKKLTEAKALNHWLFINKSLNGMH